MLDVANAMLKEHDPECIVTAIAGILDPGDATLTFATAGHPLPLLRKSDGHVVAFEGAAPPLGVYEHGDAEHHFAHLDAGDIAVFYTDGVIELTRDAYAGEALLRSLLLGLNAQGSDHAAALSIGMVGSTIPEDDVALLTIMRDAAA
jgi:sigma-B regulation protein RsbU (phosphoserine phosphatase)